MSPGLPASYDGLFARPPNEAGRPGDEATINLGSYPCTVSPSLPSPPQSHETVTKALQEDPTIFDYDGHYDNMVEQRKKADPRLKKKDTKVIYINFVYGSSLS